MEAMGGLIFLAAVFALLFGWLRAKHNRRQRIATAYEAAKVALRQSPNDSFLRDSMLVCGRKYYSSLGGQGVLSTYDEQAINNDMIAIIGSSPR